jgi:MoaA/NifB/PqqE/SkfB family radical SAM enzyme
METIVKYDNGNTTVTILSNGTKIREFEDVPYINHPESIDVKITDYCDMGCVYCHESSTIKGKHADLTKLLVILDELPKGVELAIGGGNPLAHPDIIDFLIKLKEKGFIPNLTVNQGHLKTYQDLLVYLLENNLIYGLGISIVNNNFTYIKLLVKLTNNIVYHVIAGVNNIDVIDKIITEIGESKFLILGYKQFGFGVEHYNLDVDKNIEHWKKTLRKYIGKCTLSFDNLGIEQLNVREYFTDEGWEQFYMGDDFCYTMYIDAVKQEYAPTSRSNKRKSFAECSLLEYFSSRNCPTEQGGNTYP